MKEKMNYVIYYHSKINNNKEFQNKDYKNLVQN